MLNPDGKTINGKTISKKTDSLKLKSSRTRLPSFSASSLLEFLILYKVNEMIIPVITITPVVWQNGGLYFSNIASTMKKKAMKQTKPAKKTFYQVSFLSVSDSFSGAGSAFTNTGNLILTYWGSSKSTSSSNLYS